MEPNTLKNATELFICTFRGYTKHVNSGKEVSWWASNDLEITLQHYGN